MATVKTASGPFAGKFGELEAARPSATWRRGHRRLRPIAEGLEPRTLLSVGLDPTWGFRGESALIVPPDTSTTTGTESYSSIAMQNGQVVAVGTMFSTTPFTLFVRRFNTSGSIDTSFGTNGTETIPLTYTGGTNISASAADIAVQTNGDIDILAGSSSNAFLVVQLTPNGPIDTTFGTSGFQFISFSSISSTATYTAAKALAIGPDGKIVAVGDTDESGSGQVFAVARLNPDGTLDTSFNGTGTATVAFNVGGASSNQDYATGVAVQPDDRIVVVGYAEIPSNSPGTPGSSYAAVARLAANGTLDTSFNGTGELTYTYNLGGDIEDSAAAVTLDGNQIVIAGATTQEPSGSGSTTLYASDLTVTRLNSDGSFDTSFNGSGKYMLSLSQAGIAFNCWAASVVARPSGSLLIGGSASQRINSYSGGWNFGLLLSLTPTGAPDTTFGTDGLALVPDDVNSRLVLQPDGEVFFWSIESSDKIESATGPVPAVVSTSMITTGAAKKAQATGVTITFNTAINRVPASQVKVYLIRHGKGKKAIKVKKVSYDSTTSTLTLRFSRTAAKEGFRVAIAPGIITGDDGEDLFEGAVWPIVIAPPAK